MTFQHTGYTVIDHLLDRLTALGVDRMFGVPGDFTLTMLDRVEAHPDVEWVGCSAELGAAYAADGYARVRGLGVVCTTFGVGELSAINGIAGSYAERVPVIHVVGAPATATQRAARPTHHTLGDGDFRHFARMHAEVTGVQASLTLENATSEIDHVIREVLERRLPGYIVIPTDVGMAEVEPAVQPLLRHSDPTNPKALARFREAVTPLMLDSKSPTVLADILVERFGAQDALHDLLATGVLHSTLLWGRRVVDESVASFVGTYIGAASRPIVRDTVEKSDALIQVGVQFTDLTTGFFSQNLPVRGTIVVDGTTATVDGVTYGPIAMARTLEVLAVLIRTRTRPLPLPAAERPPTLPKLGELTSQLMQGPLWSVVASWLRSGDMVIAEQGTSFYGISAHRLPKGVLFMGQPLWASIGFTLPALLGASLAAPHRRPILLIGDGAAQLTIGELGTLVRNRVPAIVIVVDNDGYTVERAIHGSDASYNDIATWDWVGVARAMGVARAERVETTDGLRAALNRARAASDGVSMIVAAVPKNDVPPLLEAIARAAASANAAR
jgi:TPP-dependent 2-oxoacid decarboxylase